MTFDRGILIPSAVRPLDRSNELQRAFAGSGSKHSELLELPEGIQSVTHRAGAAWVCAERKATVVVLSPNELVDESRVRLNTFEKPPKARTV